MGCTLPARAPKQRYATREPSIPEKVPPVMSRAPRFLLPTAVVCLLLSGAAGLVYQIVWMRYLALFLGHTSYAIIAVLVSFMGGLALGNAWFGARADRTAHPLALYAWLEIGIGVFALVFPFYYEAIHRAYLAAAAHLTPGGLPAFGLKFFCSLLTILLPTTLMGGTLPVMTRLVTRSLGELRERVANLYFVNSAGAVAGCFLADFWWIPALGLEATVLAGAALNLGAGLLALVVHLQGADSWKAAPGETAESAADERYTAPEWRLAVIGAGVSGFVAMLYEVVWTRMLALSLGSSSHAFSIMLLTFITGIAAGSWVVTRWRGLRRSLDAFGYAELALALTLILTVGFYVKIPHWFVQVASVLARQPQAYPLYEVAQGLICFLVMFVPTLCLGMTLPLATRAASHDVRHTGRSVGTVFAVNTVGTVLGAALTGLLLLPALGLARTFFLGIALNAALGVFTLCRRWLFPHPALTALLSLALVTVMIPLGGLVESRWQRMSSLALWRLRQPPDSAAYADALRRVNLLYYRDGAGSTVTVDALHEGGETNLTLRVNGKPDASTGFDMPTQMLCGHIPALLHPAPRDALVVGLGSGVTAGALAQHPELERVEVVEISPEVVEAARCFASYNHAVHDHPKVRLVVDDAKSFLKTTRRTYDVIVSEPSNPWMAGVAGVFSQEYYTDCRSRLATNGLMLQWVQAYETDDQVLEIVLNTFLSVFPYASLWQTDVMDLLLVGSLSPPAVDLNALQQRFGHPAVRADLERIDLFRLPVLLALEVIPATDTRHLLPPTGRIHSDYYPILEFAAQRAFFVQSAASLAARYDQNQWPRPATLFGEYLKTHPLTEKDLQALTLFHFSSRIPHVRLVRSALTRWHREHPEAAEPLEFLFQTRFSGSHAAREVEALRPLPSPFLEATATNPQPLRDYASLLYEAYSDLRSAFYVPPTRDLESALQRLIEVDPPRRLTCLLLRAELAWDRGDDAACSRLAQEAFRDLLNAPPGQQPDPKAATVVLTRIIETLWRQGRLGEAREWCQLARRQGYITEAGSPDFPPLNLVCRKVEFTLDSAGAPAESVTPSPSP